MKLVALALVCLSLSTAGAAGDRVHLPAGWRFPTEKELADQDRQPSPTRYAKAVADFNGDGVPDEAILVKSTKFSGQGLLVRLSDGKQGFTWVTLDTTDWGPEYPEVNLTMAIDVLPPGTHRYICIETESGCIGEQEPRAKMTIKRPSLSYYRFESAASLFYWDSRTNRFVRVWLSD
jgi:hypothetical protein